MTAERNKTRADLLARLWGPGVYPVEYARALVNPLRHLICPAWLIVRRLQVKPTDRVLEIGSGPGYFSPSVARRLTEGRLTLYDVQIGMLEMAAKRLERCGCGNFECRAGDAASLPFPDRAFDLAFMVAVLGEVSDRAAAMREAARVLRPGGRLSVTELPGDPDFVRLDEMQRRAREVGLDFERRYGPRWYFTCNFVKPSEPHAGLA
jgi:SAM-dependent methyltransferase